MSISRRIFLKKAGCAGCALACAGTISKAAAAMKNSGHLFEARYYDKLDNRKIRCNLCPRECVIDDLERGYCGVRENQGGTYYSLVYGKACSAHIDPVEKKPLFHFLPGTNAFSISTVGCNVMCKFCQNWEISQSTPEQIQSYDLPPENVAAIARQKNCSSIAYTYGEPVVFTEYMYDSAQAGHGYGVKSVMISNGYIQEKPMRDLCKVLDAVKIDLKAYTERFYKELVSGELRPVLDTLALLREENMWNEIVYLVIPNQNDDPRELRDMCKWIVKELGEDVPIHFSRFHPQYRLKNVPPTPVQTLKKAHQIALDSGLHYAYIGNVPGDPAESTYCPACGKVVIRRIGYSITENNLNSGKCSACGNPIAGVWQS